MTSITENTGDLARVLTRVAAAAFLQEKGYPISPKRLAKLAHEGGGPLYRRWGNRAIYLPTELLRWAESRASSPHCHSSGHDTRALLGAAHDGASKPHSTLA
jgi:hypothetical protein